jgi:hypothetical protein
VEFHPAAFKHGYTERDIRHALELSISITRWLPTIRRERGSSGFAPDATLLEVLVLHTAGSDLVVHCMKARKTELDKALRSRGRC